jgi:tRNA threonylcarbamoyladenosine biosynthesis protein TsaE
MPNWIRQSSDALVCQVSSEEETRDVGHDIASKLAAGDVVALIGDLGAGKTRFVKAVAEAWGVSPDDVNSPTFTLIQEYAGRLPIRHCDTFRLRNPEEFADLGLDELFASDGISLVEWSDRVEEYLPRDLLEVRITIDSPTGRTIAVAATGNRSRQILSQIR